MLRFKKKVPSLCYADGRTRYPVTGSDRASLIDIQAFTFTTQPRGDFNISAKAICHIQIIFSVINNIRYFCRCCYTEHNFGAAQLTQHNKLETG